MDEFPIEADPSQLLGMVELIKENGGSEYISILAEDANEQIDDLLPLVDAVTLFKFAEVKNGIISLTDRGLKITSKNFHSTLRAVLESTEPFKTASQIVSKGEVTTRGLTESLKKSKITFHNDPQTNEELLRDLMLRWASRVKLFDYDSETDTWKYIPKKRHEIGK